MNKLSTSLRFLIIINNQTKGYINMQPANYMYAGEYSNILFSKIQFCAFLLELHVVVHHSLHI